LTRVLRPGKEYPLGATFDGVGANFAVFSQNATRLVLCLFDDAGNEERLPMRAGPAHVWHVYVGGVSPGQRYGYRADGPYDPSRGHRFNPYKLLVDPYARALSGKVDYRAPVFGYAPPMPGEARHDRVMDARDDAWGVPRSIVVDPAFDWGEDAAPETPWPDTVIYELHVKSFTKRHPGVPEAERGTYLGVACDAAIAHLQSIGVTAVELMPVHECCDEHFVAKRGMTNYWGYSTLGYFAPDQRFASARGAPWRQVDEFKTMVKRLHAASIEVILDVVYNHTCEGDRLGPTLFLRGLDNATYYRLDPADRGKYVDTTGTGHSVNADSPQTLKLIMDSLRYWAIEMRVDGFRFDLAPTLARGGDPRAGLDKMSAFFDIIHQDPCLSRVKLIAEPWDLGDGGYQVGNFPVLWREWNGRYRDTVRRFWIGDRGKVGDMGYRLTGSSDLYGDDGRHPHASINFVTAHDGFTLRDLVSYEKKHNEANGEDNKDGWDDNASWNSGVEGETSDPAVRAERAKRVRSFLATLFLSQGVPMIASGDEIGKTQRGNNNAYVQDNELSWLQWEGLDVEGERRDLLAFVRRLAAVRRAHAAFRRRTFLKGEPVGPRALRDGTWLRPLRPADAARASVFPEMSGDDWAQPARAALGLLLAGDGLGAPDDGLGPRVVDDTFLLLLNAEPDAVRFRLPSRPVTTSPWRTLVDTSARTGEPAASLALVEPGKIVSVDARSLLLLATPTPS
jgi:glycogen operon protein